MSLGYHFCFGLTLIDLLDLFVIMDLLNLTDKFMDDFLDAFLDALKFSKLCEFYDQSSSDLVFLL